MKNSVHKSALVAISMSNWNSSCGRTSQIMSRFARYRSVYFVESPIIGVSPTPMYLLRETRDDVQVIEPYIPSGLSVGEQLTALRSILDKFIADEHLKEFTLWTDTPKSVPMIKDLRPSVTIYDCLHDYSATHAELEKEIFEQADVVFTSSHSLYAAKRSMHPNIHNNPDSLDYRHFYQARYLEDEPEDQQDIPHPRIGFSGDIDYKIDFELIRQLAEMRPDWNFVLLGEVKGLTLESLPKMANVHFLGPKSYSKLPLYLAGWDASFLPYKVSEETRYLNPRFVGESLIAGIPMVASPLPDLVTMYDGQNILNLAEFPIDFDRALQTALSQKQSALWSHAVDQVFKGTSWEKCCLRLAALEKDIYGIKAQINFPQTLKQFFMASRQPEQFQTKLRA